MSTLQSPSLPELHPVRCAGADTDACHTDVQITVGIVHLEDIALAVPVEYLIEVIDRPHTLSRLLTASPHVAGGLDLRGDLVPVIDLRFALKLPPRATSSQRIVIIRHRGYLFGIVIDALGGVIKLGAERCQVVEVVQPDAPPLIRQVFSIEDGSRVISMLCLEGVIHQLDVPLTKQRDHSAEHLARKVVHEWNPYVLFQASGCRLAMDAGVVDTVISVEGLSPTVNRCNSCLGVIRTEARDIAVLDLLQVLGMGQSDRAQDRQVLVLKAGANRVGVLISEVTQITRLDDKTCRPIPAMSFARPHLFDGAMPSVEHGDFLRIDAQALLDDVELSSMASIHGRPRKDDVPLSDDGQRSHNRHDAYMTFQIGTEFACALKDVRELIPVPHGWMPMHRAGDPRRAVFTHRGEGLLVVDMAVLLGGEPQLLNAESRLLVVSGERATIALLVEQVFAIEQASWEHRPIVQDQWKNADELTAAVHACGLLTLGSVEQRSVPALDLKRIVLALERVYSPEHTLEHAA